MNQPEYKKFLERLQSETLYFKNEFEGAVIKSIPKDGYFVKFKDGEEFKAENGSGVIADGVIPDNEISEKQYTSF